MQKSIRPWVDDMLIIKEDSVEKAYQISSITSTHVMYRDNIEQRIYIPIDNLIVDYRFDGNIRTWRN